MYVFYYDIRRIVEKSLFVVAFRLSGNCFLFGVQFLSGFLVSSCTAPVLVQILGVWFFLWVVRGVDDGMNIVGVTGMGLPLGLVEHAALEAAVERATGSTGGASLI
jgi:hypothetical protein